MAYSEHAFAPAGGRGMAYSDNAFALASGNQPVRDELVLSLDDIFPELKSAEGIPVQKHNKRGQNENRRLRLDTDVSILEVFRTGAGYLNRRITKRYNLSLLEEVGPATSVPGGLPATPGRTVVFVFHNHTLYVTVKSRDVCAALVALFRPAGGPASHASPPSGSNGIQANGGGDAIFSGRKAYASPLSPSPGASVWRGRPPGKRAPERGMQRKGGSAKDLGGVYGRKPKESAAAADGVGLGRGRGRAGNDCRRNAYGRHHHQENGGRRQSASDLTAAAAAAAAEPDTFDMDGTFLSSSDEDVTMTAYIGVQPQQGIRLPSSRTPPLTGSRLGGSPDSTQSSESPDAIIRSRMVGFGSADAEMGTKPKRGGRSFRHPWARFADGDRKDVAAGVTSQNVGLASGGKPPEGNARQSAEVVASITAASETTVSNHMAGVVNTTTHFHGRTSASPRRIRSEDRLIAESLRRPASAPTVVETSEKKGIVTMSEGQVELPPAKGEKPKMAETPSPRKLLGVDGGRRTGSSPQAKKRGSVLQDASTSVASSKFVPLLLLSQQQKGRARRLDGSLSATRIPSPPRGEPAIDQATISNERIIPRLPRPFPNGQWPSRKNGVPVSETIRRHEGSDGSLLPHPLRDLEREKDRATLQGKIVAGLGLTQSSSADSLDDEEFYGEHRIEDSERLVAASSRSKNTVHKETVVAALFLPPDRETRRPAPIEEGGSGRRGRREMRVADERYMYDNRPISARNSEGGTPRSFRELITVPEERRSPIETALAETDTNSGEGGFFAGGENALLVRRLESFGPPSFNDVLSKLTIKTASSFEEAPAPSEAEAGTARRHDMGLFSMTPQAFNSRGSRGSRRSFDRRTSGGTDCTSPGSPPGGAVGEGRALAFHISGVRPIPPMSDLHLGGATQENPRGPSGFEELWAVLEPTWGINSSFGMSMAPKVMLLNEVYHKMRSFQVTVARVCVKACGPVLGEVCRKCGRAWAVLTSASQKAIAEFPAMANIKNSIDQLIEVVDRYEASAVVRRFTLPLIGAPSAWEELLAAEEGGDLQKPCQQIENAIALLPEEQEQGAGKGGGGRGGGGRGSGSRLGMARGGTSKRGRWSSKPEGLRLPPCPSYWAKGQFDRLTPAGLADVLTLLHEPARFAELAQLVTRASDLSPANSSYGLAWDCVRQAEGPALGRELRQALSATLVAAGELLPLPRVPPPPPAYVARERLTEQIEATILHPFLPLGIAGIGGASGSGKTVLAAAVVRDVTVRCRFGDRVFWLHAGKGAQNRLISLLQTLADTVYAWLTDDGKHGSKRARGSGGGSSDNAAEGGFDPNLREPVRFRDQEQAVNYVVDLCRGPLLAGLRCLVVLDDVHEREVVDALWKSGCQLLVTSPVEGLLQAVGAEVTIAQPLENEVAELVATGAAGEDVLCKEAHRLVNLCCGCPLALAMSGAIAQALLSAGNDNHTWRNSTPRTGGGQIARTAEEHETGLIGGGWSLGIGNTFINLAAPVGAWVEQVVVGSVSIPNKKPPQHGDALLQEGRRGAGANQVVDVEAVAIAGDNVGAAVDEAVPLSLEARAWVKLAGKVDRKLAELKDDQVLWQMLVEAGPETELPVRKLMAVLTQVALEEADRIIGGSGWAFECCLSFGLLPEGLPLPPPALEEFWRKEEGPEKAGNTTGSSISGKGTNSAFAEAHRPPGPVEIFEALRLLGRAGGGEGADGLIPHGVQRLVLQHMTQQYPDAMAKMLDRRVRILSRMSSLVGTFDDDCWALGGSEEARIKLAVARKSGGSSNGGSVVVAGGTRMVSGCRRENTERGVQHGVYSDVDTIPTGLLGSGRHGPPSHGYGGFSRYDYLVASWDALPAAHTLPAAAGSYLVSVRGACSKVAAQQNSSGGGWAAARALASAADLYALAGRSSEAIPAYEKACELLVAEAARSSEVEGVPRWQKIARKTLHKVATMVQELAMLAAHFGKEAPAIRLLQRTIEIHLSVLEASGALVPDLDGNGGMPGVAKGRTESSKSRPVKADEAEASADNSDFLERGKGITYRAVADDNRSLPSRLWLQPPVEGGESSPSSRGGGGSIGGGGGSVGGGNGGTLPTFGRLDLVATCVGDLGLVVSCTRQLRQEKRVDESIQLAEKVFPVLKEILGADHAFTKAALAAFVGQGIVDECWSQADANSGSSLGHPSLPSPTSRRRLARTYDGRGASAVGGGGGACTERTSVAPSTLSDLSSPPSPFPEEFYARYTSSYNSSQALPICTPSVQPRGGDGAGGGVKANSSGGRRSSSSSSRHHHNHRGRSGSLASNNDSTSSGTDGDDEEESDPPGEVSRRAGRVGKGNGIGGPVSNPRFSTDGSSPHVLRRESQGHGGWHPEAGGLTVAAGRGRLGPASTRMQQEFYFRHRTLRARAHAFLITAATRARLKNADRAKAGIFLQDLARQAGAHSGGGGGGGPAREGSLGTPDGATQMAKLTALTRRR